MKRHLTFRHCIKKAGIQSTLEEREYSCVITLLLFFILTNSSHAQHSLDQLQYNYNSSTNQLNYITDDISTTTSSSDLENQSLNNYDYDSNGQLTKDESEGILTINWNAKGLIKMVSIDDTEPQDGIADRSLEFKYDALGNRVKKIETLLTNGTSTTTFYIRNGDGKLISTYIDEGSGATRELINTEVGTDIVTTTSPATSVYTRNIGYKKYELNDHLGSVRAVVNDVKEPNSTYSAYSSTIEYAADYYCFGSLLEGRNNLSGYNYGYQGKEMDDEMSGNGISYDFGARIYDARLGRWLSIDPLAEKYPYISPYVGMGDNPTTYLDPDGREIKFAAGTSIGFKIGFNLTMTYLKAQGLGDVISELQNSKYTIYIGEGNSPSASDYIYAANGKLAYVKVRWNPNLGLAIEEGDDASGYVLTGETLSPAMILYHELAHALHMVKDYKRQQKDNNTNSGDNMDNNEEARTILIEEHDAAEKLNEPYRWNHRGKLYVTRGPLSSQPAFATEEPGSSTLSVNDQVKLAKALSPILLMPQDDMIQAEQEIEINTTWNRQFGEDFYEKGQINAGIFSRTEGGYAEKIVNKPKE